MVVLWLGLSAMHAYCEEEEDGEEGDDSAEDHVEGEEEGGDPPEGSENPRLSAEQLHRLHAKIDADGNGKVSLQEVMAFSHNISKSIASSDAKGMLGSETKDGKLSLEEHISDTHVGSEDSDEDKREKEERRKLETAKFRVADLNGDGIVDSTELPALFFPEAHPHVLQVVVQDAMRRKDADGDGKLTKKEFHQDDPDMEEMVEEDKEEFTKLDTNGDGFVDYDELLVLESGRFHEEEAMKLLFNLADKDGDMQLTAEEFVAEQKELAEEEKMLADEAHSHFSAWAQHLEL